MLKGLEEKGDRNEDRDEDNEGEEDDGDVTDSYVARQT